MSLFTRDSSNTRSLILLAVVTLVACGDDSATGGNGAGPEGGSNQGGETSGPGGNGSGGAPQAGEAPGGSAQGGNAQGGNGEGGIGEGGQGGGSSTTIADLCQSACGYLAGCFSGDPASCIVECSADLGDCSPTQLDEVDSCNQAAMNDCNLVNDFESCLQAVTCITGT